MVENCDLCGKDRKEYNGLVWYSGDTETNLCRSCYLRWCKSEECNSLEIKYKDAKPTTELWHKKCEELQSAFDKWFYANGGVDEK